jgi:hypothetical protein
VIHYYRFPIFKHQLETLPSTREVNSTFKLHTTDWVRSVAICLYELSEQDHLCHGDLSRDPLYTVENLGRRRRGMDDTPVMKQYHIRHELSVREKKTLQGQLAVRRFLHCQPVAISKRNTASEHRKVYHEWEVTGSSKIS